MIDGSISVDLNYERIVAWNRHEGRHGKAMKSHKTLANSKQKLLGDAALDLFVTSRLGRVRDHWKLQEINMSHGNKSNCLIDSFWEDLFFPFVFWGGGEIHQNPDESKCFSLDFTVGTFT